MTTALHLPARPDAPIACDMSTATDTPEARLADYRALFDSALLRSERRADSVVLTFRDDPGIRDSVDDLASREAACCPFLDLRVETIAGEVAWTIAGDGRDGVNAILGMFHGLPDHAGVERAHTSGV